MRSLADRVPMKKKSRGLIRGSFSFRRIRFWWRGETVHYGGEFCVRGWSKDLERLGDVSDAPVRTDYEQRSIINFVLGIVCAIQLADLRTRVAGEENGEVLIPRPGRECSVGIHTDAQDDDFASVVEERGVLITVRLHLNRSAFRSRLIKEREDYGTATIVRKSDGRLEKPVLVGADEREIRSDVVDRGAGYGRGKRHRLLREPDLTGTHKRRRSGNR